MYPPPSTAIDFGSGLRAGEACGLRLRDIDTDRCLVAVRGGKFGKSRLVLHGAHRRLVEEQAGRRRARGTAAGPDPAPAGRAQRVGVHQADNLVIESALSRTLGQWSG
jgi:integrase